MAVGPDIVGNALNAFEEGKKMRAAEKSKNALATIFGGEMQPRMPQPGQTPGIGDGVGAGTAQIPWGDLTPEDARTAYPIYQAQQKQAQEQQAKHNEQLQMMGRLLNHATDEGTYQQSLAAAKQARIDVSSAPPTFDPNWVGQQKLVLSAFEKDGGQQISGLARELTDAGYKPGTPEFQQAMGVALRGKYAPQYTDQQGNMRQGSLPALPGMGQAPQPAVTPASPAQEPITFEMFSGAVNGLGPQKAAEWLQRNGLPVQVNTPEQAHQLPRGTRIILPDGSEGVVP